MGGLSAAIHMRLKGWDVEVVEQGQTAGGKAAGIALHGFNLDPGPSIIILPEIYEAVFRSAGKKMEDYLVFDRLDTMSRVFMEGSTPFDLPASRKACIDLIAEIAPVDAKPFAELMAKMDRVAPLVFDTVFKKEFASPVDFIRSPKLLQFGLQFSPFRNFRTMVDSMFQSPLLRAFFYGFPSYSGQTYDSQAPGAFMIPYFMIERGVFFPRGGVRAIPDAFQRLATELGVTFRFETCVESIKGSGSVAEGVSLKGGETIPADAVISNWDKLSALAPRDGVKDWPPSLSYFTAHWGIDQFIPDLAHHNLYIPSDFESSFVSLYEKSEFPARPVVYLNAVGEKDPFAAPAEKSLLFAVVTSPAKVPGIDWSRDSAEYVRRTKNELAVGGLHWDEGKEMFCRIQNADTFASVHGNYRGSLYGPEEKYRTMGLFPLTNRDSQWRNVAFCGGSVQPGAGLPMVTLSGKFAAERISPGS